MKLIMENWKRFLKKETESLVEGLKKDAKGVLVDLYEFSNLAMGKSDGAISGLDISQGMKTPVSMTLSLTVEPSALPPLPPNPKVFISNELLGQPFEVMQFEGYTFILN